LKSGVRTNIVPNRAEIVWKTGTTPFPETVEKIQRQIAAYLQTAPDARATVENSATLSSVVFLGKSAHGSRPEDGRNAALDALHFLASQPDLPCTLPQVCSFLHAIGADFYGTPLDIAASHPFIGKTTVNLGILDIAPEKATAVLNIRQTPGMTLPEMLQRIHDRVQTWAEKNGMTASVQFTGKTHEPLYLNPDEHPELITALQNAYRSVVGEEAELCAESGTTYAKAFPNALCFGPVLLSEEESLAHQADERIAIPHLLRNVHIYALLLLQLATGISQKA
jgi:succinyl-diaminopimelate desuccinylase